MQHLRTTCLAVLAAALLCGSAQADQLIGADGFNITLYDPQTGLTRNLVDVRSFNPAYTTGGRNLSYDPFHDEIFTQVVQTAGGVGVSIHTLGIDATSGHLLSDMTFPPGNVPGFFDSTWGFDMVNQVNALSATVAGSAAQIAQLQQSVNALGTQLNVLDQKSDAQSAIASAMGFATPTDGNANRFGTNLGTFGGATAVGFTYTHVAGQLDFHAGVGTTGHYTAGSVGVGFSW